MHREKINSTHGRCKAAQIQRVLLPPTGNIDDCSISGRKPETPLLLMMLYFKPPSSTQIEHSVQEETADFNERFRKMLEDLRNGENLGNKDRFPDYMANITTAVRFNEKEEYGKEKRRTGEPVYIHFERVFLRGLHDMLPVIPEHASVVYTSFLSRFFHDSKEDLRDFSITLLENGNITNTYEISHKGAKSRYFLQLTPDEKDLLEMQIEALTIPKEFSGKTKNGNGAKEQMNHLLGVVGDIRFKFGNLAAHLTLRIKIDDRLDNLMTYFKSNSVFTKDRLYNKLDEVLTLFPNIEQSAHDYFKEYIATFPLENKQQEPNGESAVLFCQELMERRSYTNLLKHHLIKEVKPKQKDETQNFLKDFHLPTLPQASFPSAIV